MKFKGTCYNQGSHEKIYNQEKTFVNFIRERNELGASSSADVVRAESRELVR